MTAILDADHSASGGEPAGTVKRNEFEDKLREILREIGGSERKAIKLFVETDGPLSTEQIAKTLGYSRHYAEKVLSHLNSAGLLERHQKRHWLNPDSLSAAKDLAVSQEKQENYFNQSEAMKSELQKKAEVLVRESLHRQGLDRFLGRAEPIEQEA